MLRYGTATNKLAQRRHRLDFRHYLIQSGSLAWTVCDVVAIGELAAGVAHEINNPLTIVAGFAEALMDCDLPQGAGSHAQRIYTESQRAAKIVHNLLAFARKRELSKRYIHLPDVLARAIEVQTCLPGGLPRTMADEHQLVQVILSILANAEQAWTGTQNGGKIIINAAQVGERCASS